MTRVRGEIRTAAGVKSMSLHNSAWSAAGTPITRTCLLREPNCELCCISAPRPSVAPPVEAGVRPVGRRARSPRSVRGVLLRQHRLQALNVLDVPAEDLF